MALTPVQFRCLLLLVFLSGASGLVYQVVWHKYLAILFGAQARATALVLGLFLGGISVGYATFGRWCRWKAWNLLTVYVIVEVALGLWALAFPTMFHLAMPAVARFYETFGVGNLAIDVVVTALLVGPPTFLMGGTLPLLTQSLSHDLKEASGTHAKIYGVNTVGACVGCLMAGYVLVPTMTLSIATYVAAVGNFIVAAGTFFFFARRAPKNVPDKTGSRGLRAFFTVTLEEGAILAIGFLSGFVLITLETILVRLMGLSTGSSNYNFTLVVAIFICGLGLGSLIVRRIGEADPRRLFWNQLSAAAALCLLYFTADSWAYVVHVLRALLRDIPQNFFVYQAMLAVFFFALLAVPIGFAGLTLPLCFHLLRDRKERLGERVGQLYGLNTLGCVAGAVGGGYLFLNVLDLDHLFRLCVFFTVWTVGLAAWLGARGRKFETPELVGASAIVTVILCATLFAPSFRKERFIQPFRQSSPMEATFQGPAAFGEFLGRASRIVYWKDGPNTSVGIGSSEYQGRELSRSIIVNGKSDGNTRGDYFTTVLLGHIPSLLTKKIEKSCVIGFGTGVTVGSLARYSESKQIDVVEISNFSISSANLFDAYNGGSSRNPKVKFHEMDAFRFLAGTGDRFDIVVSEPSNPWVAGIENLYAGEFYDIALRKLETEGTFVQWIHTYSFTDELLRMVFRTMSSRFPFVYLFHLKGGDLALVGRRLPFERSALALAEQRFLQVPVRAELAAAGVRSLEAVLALELAQPDAIRRLAENAPEHSLESPRLSNGAARAFFESASARPAWLRRQAKEYFQGLDRSLLALRLGPGLPSVPVLNDLKETYCDSSQSKTPFLCEEILASLRLKKEAVATGLYESWMPTRDLASLASFERVPAKVFDKKELNASYALFETYKRFASPIARIPREMLFAGLQRCLATVPPQNELWGECMLQRVLILEMIDPPGEPLKQAVAAYLDWFPRLANTSENYVKLEEARNILLRMSATLQ